MKKTVLIYIVLCWCLLLACDQKQESTADYITIKKVPGLTITGDGTDPGWADTEWITIPKLTNDSVQYTTVAKILYSDTGLYFLFRCSDSILTNTLQSDRSALYNEDVIEVFLQPDTSRAAYFEYEISPLNYETPILVFNEHGDLNSWHPFELRDKRKIIHNTTVILGDRQPNAKVQGWTAEFYIPFNLLSPLYSDKTLSGKRWKGNLYRIDYDKGEALWSWKANSGDFHEYNRFGYFHFE